MAGRHFGVQSVGPHLLSPYANVWMKLCQNGSVSTGTPTASRMFLIPFHPARAFTISEVGYEITTQGVSGAGTDRMRFGVYASDASTGRPTGSPLADFGDVDLEATVGVKAFNVTNLAVVEKIYWFAVARQTTGTIVTAGVVRTQLPGVQNYHYMDLGTGSTPSVGTNAGSYGQWYQDSVTGALPSIGTLVADAGQAPAIWLRSA